ncbi:hypothetical protein [Mechercharimyces sp. CAU 1602]|uniref:hypothetical protein n=1 Tax=Mechercharimyces sp. CAU 1602 TaxID=2973933 RepID=UPI002162FF30|nr:hypothetical protein [Mechercharimyces sp. CAU 1602]MCS1351872.1 hypothetical protein [Mechercharimyces sp. CAU 1602]
MSDSLELYIFEPVYIPIMLLILGLLYPVYLAITLSKIKLNVVTGITFTISFLLYLLVGLYMTDGGYYSDGQATEPQLFHGFGFLELILLSFPYIFLALGAGLGEKRK